MTMPYQHLVQLTLDACFHIKIHSAKHLWAFFESLSLQQHLFIQHVSRGRYIALIDYQDKGLQQYLVVQTRDSGEFWTLCLDESLGWSIVEGLSTGETR